MAGVVGNEAPMEEMMAKRTKGPGGDTPQEARTDGNVTRLPVAGRGRAKQPVPSKVGPQAVVAGEGEAEGGVPQTPEAERRAATDDDLTADALRHALDRGEGGDKVDFTDPAAAPLGTDDEAAGFSPTRAQVAEAARQELGAHRPLEEKRARRTIPGRARGGAGIGFVLMLVVVGLVLIGLSLVLDGI